MILHRAGQPRVERVAVEVGEARQIPFLHPRAREPEPAAAERPLAREDPVEAVERAFRRARVRLHAADQRRDQGRLGRAVRSVDQHQLVHAPGAHEVAERAVQRRLHLLLPGHPPRAAARIEGEVEQLPAPDRPHRGGPVLGAEVIEHVAQVLRRRACLPARRLQEGLHVLGEREDRAVLDERALHTGAHRREPALSLHDGLPVGSP